MKDRFQEALFVPCSPERVMLAPIARFREYVAAGTINERGWWYRKKPPREWIIAALAAIDAQRAAPVDPSLDLSKWIP